jgi:hypothetical protein
VARNTEHDEPGTDVAELPDSTLRLFADMAVTIPEEDEDASARILEQVLLAQSWEDLSNPWQSSDMKALKGKTLRLDAPKRLPSTFEGGLGIFLVVPYTDTDTGDKGVLTTSSWSVVGQLVRAWTLKSFPLIAEVVVADRPTKRGYYPHHLNIIGSGGNQS